MKKKILFLVVSIIMFIAFLGCSASEGTFVYESNMEVDNEIINLADGATPERLIIYNVDISFDVRDLDEAAEFLDGLIADDEWFDQENLTSNRYSYVIRVKTDRLDDFISSLKEELTLRSYSKTGTDISLEYQDTSNRILALEAQLTRLLELYEDAELSEMIIINEQISNIEVELQQLNGELAVYDSLVEYSVVTLVFYGSTVTTQSPFFNRLGNAFVDGFDALIVFFDGLIIVLATISPFLAVIGVVTVIVVVSIKKKKAKQSKSTISIDEKN